MDLLYKVEFKDLNLLVRLEERNSKRILYLDTLKSLAKEADRDALALLIKIHLRSPNASRGADTLSFQQIEVNPALSYDALRSMAKTGRLFFQGKPLAISSAPLVKLYWKGEKQGEKACNLAAFFQIQGKDVPVEACAKVFPGTPFWLIYESVLFSFSSSVSWKWIERFLAGPQFLEGMQKKKFLEEEAPVVWKEQAPEKPLQVFPELILKDGTGSFADLWMEYPGVGCVAVEDLAPSVQGKARLKKEEAAWEKDLIECGFLRKKVGDSNYYVPTERASSCLLLLLDVGWKIKDARGRTVYRQGNLDFSVEEKEGAIAIRGQVCFGEETASFRSHRDALQQGRMWVEISDGKVGLLDRKKSVLIQGDQWDEEGKTLCLPKAQAVAALPLLDIPSIQWEGSVRRMAEGLRKGADWETALPDPSFKGTLLPYQQKGVDWLALLHRWGFSGLLADEMGLGKTVQVLAFFSRLNADRGRNLPILIVAPTSLLFNWQAEIRRFLSIEVYIHSGPHRLKGVDELKRLPWIVTSYALLRLDEEILSQIEFEAIALDESNAIKTSATQTAKAAYRLKGRFRIALSGTPVENRLEEIGSQFQFLLPDLKFSLKPNELESVRRKLKPFILRRRKEEVQIDLPEKMEQAVWIEMEEAQRQVYESYRTTLRSGLLKKVGVEGIQAHRMEVLEAILRLRQICCDPRLVGDEIGGAKLQRLKEEIEEAVLENRKMLVYSQFTSMLHLIRTELNQKGIHPLYLDGSMSGEKRGELVQAFQEDPNCLVFLLSLKAGGVGLNLTAAETVVLFDPWWNEAVERQAIDRAHRIGQKKTVMAKRYLIPGTVEEKIQQLKAKKQSVADQLLEDQGDWSVDDLFSLLD
jgi:superfamily II DNA or RNA helicase